MRFNPPPNWPAAPQGWTPPPDWAPDPSWGPPPPGWSLWVDDAAPPATAAYPTQSYEQTPYSPGDPQTGGYQADSYQQTPYSSGAPKGGGNRTALLAVAGVVVVALVAAGVVLLVNRGGDDTPVAAQPTTSAAASTTDGASSSGTPSSTTRTTTSAAATSTGGGSAPSGTLALGTAATVGDFSVTVTAVDLDATEEMKSESSVNPDPSNGTYVLVSISATYTGSATGDAYADLFTSLDGGNGDSYDDTSCIALAPDDLSGSDELSNGQTATGNFCLDVDPAAIPGSTVTISDSSFDPGPVWTTGG